MRKIAITTTSFAEYASAPLDLLKKNNFEVIMNALGRRLSKEETLELCRYCVGIVAGTEDYHRDILEKLTHLKVISRCGVGIENIDISATKDLGIKVMNTADCHTSAVAELTIGLILDLMRKISLMNNNLHCRRWQKMMGNLLYRKKVGIIGLGRVGRKVAQLLKAFRCEIAYTDPKVENNPTGIKQLPLKELLRWSDIITIHVSGRNRIIGEREIRQMKKRAVLINTSRGEVIDEDALYKALKNGCLSGAALDVFSKEPYDGSLRKLDNVILTPHIGSYALEARADMEIEAAKNLLKGLNEVS